MRAATSSPGRRSPCSSGLDGGRRWPGAQRGSRVRGLQSIACLDATRAVRDHWLAGDVTAPSAAHASGPVRTPHFTS